jgi:hypothetical protein
VTSVPNPPPVHKMEKARQAILQAEEALQSVTSQELLTAGYANTSKDAANMIYRVIAHATALRIVREHLWTEFLA